MTTAAPILPRAQLLALPPEHQLAYWESCAAEVLLGQPQRFAKQFLQVENKLKGPGGQALVQLKFTDNQEYYERECFTGRTSCWQPIEVTGDKARQAYMSVFWEGVDFGNFVVVNGWNKAIIAHRKDAALQLGHYIDVFWDSLPPLFKAPPYGTNPHGLKVKYWRDDFKEIEFGNGVTNRIEFFSAEANSVPRGGRFQSVHYSEGAFFGERYWLAVSAAVTPLQPVWNIWETTRNGTTYAETGNPSQHYVRVDALKQGTIKGVLLQRFWFQDRANALAPHDLRVILPGTEGDFELSEAETALLPRFPQDGVPPLDRIRWRRNEVARYVQQNGNNQKRGLAIFLQENLEDDASGWANADKTPFDVALCTQYLHRWKDGPHLVEDHADSSGMLVQRYADPVAGADYAAGQDCAEGKRDGDNTSVSIVDALDGNKRLHVARLIGRVASKVVTTNALRQEPPGIVRRYNAYFGIERNGGFGTGSLEVARDLGWTPRLFCPAYEGSMDDAQAYDRWLRDLEYGFLTTKASKERILRDLIDDFNAGQFITYFPATLHLFMNYDPTAGTHTPDELVSLAIANELAKDPRVWTQRRQAQAPLHSSVKRRRELASAGRGLGTGSGVFGYR